MLEILVFVYSKNKMSDTCQQKFDVMTDEFIKFLQKKKIFIEK